MLSVLLTLFLGVVVADPKYMTSKLCKDVDITQCSIHSVIVDPCSGGAFCALKRNKNYGITLDLTPRFSADNLKLSIAGDVDLSGNFTTTVKAPSDGCQLLSCPLEAKQRRIFDVDLMLDKKASGKFPIKVKMWNEDNESQACCVIFKIKVK